MVHRLLSCIILVYIQKMIAVAALAASSPPTTPHQGNTVPALRVKGDHVESTTDDDSFSIKRRNLLLGTGNLFLNSATTMLSQPSLATASDISCLRSLPPPANGLRLYICRHGQTENNRLQLVQGRRINVSLNDYGKLQAQLLGLALNEVVPDRVVMYHSPQLRATQTAQIAAKFMTMHNPRLVSLQDLAEIDFGPQVEGQPAPTPEQVALYQAWRAGHLEERIAGGESAVEVLERCRRVIHKVQRSKQTAAVVIGHSSHLRLLLVELLGMSLSQAQREIRLANGSITVVDLAVGQSRLVRLNESCHLKD